MRKETMGNNTHITFEEYKSIERITKALTEDLEK
jgi:hypothetical protein